MLRDHMNRLFALSGFAAALLSSACAQVTGYSNIQAEIAMRATWR